MRLASLAAIAPYLCFVHLFFIWLLLAISLYALCLSIQVRRMITSEDKLKKQLSKGRFNIIHFQIGSILLNRGKVLIGLHIFTGLGVVSLVITSASVVPFMQNHDWVRYIHILNIILLGQRN